MVQQKSVPVIDFSSVTNFRLQITGTNLAFLLFFFFLNCLDCDFTCTSSEVPVVDFSKAGSLQFEGDPERCLSGLVVAQWSYRLNTPQENKGKPNNFIIKARLSNRWSLQVRKKKKIVI